MVSEPEHRPVPALMRVPTALVEGAALLRSGPALRLRLAQLWRDTPEGSLKPGTVSLGWSPGALWILAELEDEDVFSEAKSDNERTWELGDAFEVFLKAPDAESYVEFHVTPNGKRLQLRFEDAEGCARARALGDASDWTVPEALFEFELLPLDVGWAAILKVPETSVGSGIRIEPGAKFAASFCRYDATRGAGEPVLSSSSPYTELDFHRTQEWLRFVCV